MTELLDKLLQPVSPDAPCGPDLSNDAAYEELVTILKGKPEVEIGAMIKPAEPPNWPELQQKGTEFLSRSKHLRVGVMLCCSWLKTGGLPGFRDGIKLVRGLVEQHWGCLHPQLDPEDNNDPTARLNILSALTATRGSLTGWLTVVDYLYATPLFQARGATPITFDQLQAARLRPGGGGEGDAAPDGPPLASIEQALRANSAQLVPNHLALQEALDSVQNLDQFLTNTLSAGQAMSFDDLARVLKEMIGLLETYLPSAGAGAEAGAPVASGEAEAAQSGDGGVSIAISGSIRSRSDVIDTLEKICAYYDQVEPGSAVPFLLRRAQKMVNMNFVQAVDELKIAALDALRPSMGSAVDAAVPPPPA